MIVNTSYTTQPVLLEGSDITSLVESYEVSRTNIIQAVVNLVPGHDLTPRPGQILLFDLPIVTRLVVQTYSSNTITAGCYLAVYLQANPSDGAEELNPELGQCVRGILVDRGIPASYLSVSNNTKLGSVPTLGDDPVSLANFAGYQLYSDSQAKVRLTPLLKPAKSIGSFTNQELVTPPSKTAGQPLTANKVVVEGVLSKVEDADVEYKVSTETTVRGGTREVIKEYEVRRRKTIETETIKEPKSQVSTFSSSYKPGQDPDKLISKFSSTRKQQSVTSQVTTVTTEVDRDDLLKSRTKVVTGMAAKGLSQFFAAWGGAELPPPVDDEGDDSEPEVIEVTAQEFVAAANSIARGDYDYTPPEIVSEGSPLTISKPTGMFKEIDLELESETWSWDLDDELSTITNPNTTTVSFGKNRGKCVYERIRYLPIGAILPEMGNPVFGYQALSAGTSVPHYRDGSRLVVAEKEVITYTQEESGDWIAERRLEQAIGVRNAQEPLDAMRSIQFTLPADQASRDRADVAINVATQVTLAINERVRSSPPGKLIIDDTKQFSKTRPYRFEIDMGSEDLLDRSIQISPSPFVPDIPAIVDFAKYQAMQTRGQAKQLTLQLPLQGLGFDIPPNSLLTYSGDTWYVNQVTIKVSPTQATLDLVVSPW